MTDPTPAGAPRGAPELAQPIVLTISIDPGSLAPLVDLLRRALGPAVADAVRGAHLPDPPASHRVHPPAGAGGAADPDGQTGEATGLLADVRTVARLLGVSTRTVSRLLHRGAIPSPVQFGRGKRWRLAEIQQWVEAGCPPQTPWKLRGRSPKRSGA